MKTQRDKLKLELIETIRLHQELLKIREELEKHLFKSTGKSYVKRIYFLRAIVAVDVIIELIWIEILNERWRYHEDSITDH